MATWRAPCPSAPGHCRPFRFGRGRSLAKSLPSANLAVVEGPLAPTRAAHGRPSCRFLTTSSTRLLDRALTRARHFRLTRYCPCCHSYPRQFGAHLPDPPKPRRITHSEARCPIRGALEQHPLTVLYLRQRTDSWSSAPDACSVAPEIQIARLLRHPAGQR